MSTVNKILASLLVLAALVLGISGGTTPTRRCRGEKALPLPLRVRIDDCTTLPCDLVKGTVSHMAIEFLATKNAMSAIQAEVRFTVLGVEVPYELEKRRRDVCANLLRGANCPLYTGEDVIFHLALPVSPTQPELPTRIEVSLVDQTDNSIVACFATDARIRRH